LFRSLCHFPRITRVLNTVAAGWRLAQRTAALQAAVTLATALACLLSGRDAALGALAGGSAMTLGGLAAAWSAFGGGVQGAGMALGRLLVGLAAKWVVVIVGMLLAIGVFHLPAMAVLAGAAFAAAGMLFATKLWA
jgi:F0F1-type ATP synthase assembly protein I